MESRTKVQLSPSVIQNLADNAFGPSRIISIREMKDGYFNTAYHIELGNSPFDTVLKIGPADDAEILSYERGIMRTEVDVARLLSSNPAIPVPKIHAADFGRSLIAHDYCFMEYLTGRPWNIVRKTLTPQQNATIEMELGGIIAAIAEFQNSSFGLYGGAERFDNWLEAFTWMCALLFDDAKKYSVAVPISQADFMALLARHADAFAQVATPRLVHWDLWEGNVFITQSGDTPAISGIIDFERAFWGDPLSENPFGRGAAAENFIKGYGEDILNTPDAKARRHFYNLHLYLTMIVEDGPRQYADKSTVSWAQKRFSASLDAIHQLP